MAVSDFSRKEKPLNCNAVVSRVNVLYHLHLALIGSW